MFLGRISLISRVSDCYPNLLKKCRLATRYDLQPSLRNRQVPLLNWRLASSANQSGYLDNPCFATIYNNYLTACAKLKVTDLCTQDSIISQAIHFSLCSRCILNSSSGQWRSLINDWRASSFQNKSSEVAHPLLNEKYWEDKLCRYS